MENNLNKEPIKPMGLNLGIIFQKNPVGQTPDYIALLKQMELLQTAIKDISEEIKNINEKIEVSTSSLTITFKNELEDIKKTITDINGQNENNQKNIGKMWDVGFDYKETGFCLCPCLREVRTASAIVLDLNNSGQPEVTGKNLLGDGKVSGPAVYFDIDPMLASGKDKREKTEWLLKDSGCGFLVWDADQDGKITSSRELFGNFDIDGEIRFEDGYQKLANYFDMNKDGLISGNELTGLMVWTDSNADGISQPEELKSLAELGITSLDIRNINGEDNSAIFTFNTEHFVSLSFHINNTLY